MTGAGEAAMAGGYAVRLKSAAAGALALCLWVTPLLAADEHSGHAMEPLTPARLSWTFSGPFGAYDRAQLQRGFKIYREVCSNCHSLNKISFRNLSQKGGPEFSESQVKALAAEYKIKDGPNDAGDMFERQGRPSDIIPWNFANDQAARSANGGALPPDMSLLAKARSYKRGFPLFLADPFLQYQEHGVDYIYAVLTSYVDPPKDMKMEAGQYFNPAMPDLKIAMPNPLVAIVDEKTGKPLDDKFFPDGTVANRDQVARDISAFLMWTAEPKLEERKRTGFRAMAFLLLFAGLLFYTKRKVWSDVAH